MSDTFDIRQSVLNNEIALKKQAIYVERLGGWLNLYELMGDDRAQVMQDAVSQKSGRVNLGVLYAGLLVRSVRYPHPDVQPVEPVKPEEPASDASEDEQAQYTKSLAKYKKDLAAFQHAYPTDHPKAGERVFQPTDRDIVSKNLPGGVIEEVAGPAFILSGFSEEDIAEKKASSNGTVVDGTITPLQTTSSDPTLQPSSVS